MLSLKNALITPRLRSFRGKLYGGFFSIAALTVFTTGFAVYLFDQFGKIVDTTTGKAIPELMAVMGLSANSALLAAGAPVLAASQSEQELQQTEIRLNVLAKEIRDNMDRLSVSGSNPGFDSIKQHSTIITKTLSALKTATLKRLVLQQRINTDLVRLRDVQGDLVDTINPIVYGATSLSNLFARRSGRRNTAAVKDMMEKKASLVIALLEAQSATYRILNLFKSSLDEQRQAECQSSMAKMRSQLPSLNGDDTDSHMREIAVSVKNLVSADLCNIPFDEKNLTEQRNFMVAFQRLVKKLEAVVPKRLSRLQTHYSEIRRQVKSTPIELTNVTIRNLRFALEIKAEGNLLIGLLTAVTDTNDQYTITNLFNRFRSSLEAFRNAVGVFKNSDLAQRNPILASQVVSLEDHLAAFGSGDDTLFNKRKDELAISERISALLSTHREQATRLIDEANKLVLAVQKNTFDLRDAMGQNLVTAISILLSVCIGSLLIAAFIAYITTLLLSRHESDLRAANRATELLNQELETFNYSVSHDLRAPLRSLSGFSEALLEDYGDKLDEEGKSYLKYLKESSEEMGELIAGLLKLSRSTRGEITLERVNLSKIAQTIEHKLRAGDLNRAVTVKITPGLMVNADRRLMEIVMENLLGNAWKYTSKKPHAEIEFGSKNSNGLTTFFVRDNGVGFDVTYSNKLFQPFQRLHKTAEFEGTGIGLATVKRIIRRHRGRIWAHSKVNGGATFFFTLETSGALK